MMSINFVTFLRFFWYFLVGAEIIPLAIAPVRDAAPNGMLTGSLMNVANVATLDIPVASLISLEQARQEKALKVLLRVRQFFCFWKLFVSLNNCANFFLRSDKLERMYRTSKLLIWSYFSVRLCSRLLKHEDPWKSGTKNGGESVM